MHYYRLSFWRVNSRSLRERFAALELSLQVLAGGPEVNKRVVLFLASKAVPAAVWVQAGFVVWSAASPVVEKACWVVVAHGWGWRWQGPYLTAGCYTPGWFWAADSLAKYRFAAG